MKNYKKSITIQIMAAFISVFLLIFVASFLVNQFYLEHYYTNYQKNVLINLFNELDTDTKTNISDSEWTQIYMDKNIGNITILSMDRNYNPTIYICNGNKLTNQDLNDTERRLISLMTKQSEVDKNLTIAETDSYIITKAYDNVMKKNYLELYGQFKNNDNILMRIPIFAIKDSVKLFSKFYNVILVCGFIIGIILIVIMTSKMTKPIRTLTDLSEKMSNLDFNTKYSEKHNNELDILGKNFNNMSDKLEATIHELQDANAQLEEDIKHKIEIDDLRKEFLANVSHELKTPLALIQGYTEGLMEFDDKETQEYYCNIIIDETKKMNILVKKLLDLNQIEFGHEQLDMTEFNIIDLIEGTLISSALLINNSGVNINKKYDRPIIMVCSDEFKVEQIVTNYLTNALNHVKEDDQGQKYIDISVKIRNDKIRVSVFNTGLPIPDEEIENIWVKFYKVDKAHTRAYGGSGIGLSIVKAVMNLINEDFGVVNHKNGVEFYFELSIK